MNDPTRRLCAVCSDPVDPDTAHSLHETECAKSHGANADGLCGCDAVAHPGCCPEPQCQDKGTGTTIVITARFAVPHWFSEPQVTALGRCLVEYLTSTDQPLHHDHGPDPDTWYGDDSAYICAASADIRAVHESVLDPAAVVWGHGYRCKACHHIYDDHSLDGTEGCAVKGCKCPRPVPYARLADIRGGQS